MTELKSQTNEIYFLIYSFAKKAHVSNTHTHNPVSNSGHTFNVYYLQTSHCKYEGKKIGFD